MNGLDTNILVRHLVQDDQVQSKKASHFILTTCTRESPGVINRIVLCELVWVLESAYAYPRRQIADVLEKVLMTNQFGVEDLSAAWIALRSYRDGPADFSDYFLARVNRELGCTRTVTFDKQAGKTEGFELLT